VTIQLALPASIALVIRAIADFTFSQQLCMIGHGRKIQRPLKFQLTQRLAILQVFAAALAVTVLLSLFLAGTIARPVRRLAVIHSTDAERMAVLKQELTGLLPADQIIEARFGSTLGTYIGPDALGVAITQEAR